MANEQPLPSDAQSQPELGVICPDCGCQHAYVLETRREPKRIRRRRQCRHCGRRYTTWERVVGK